MQSLTASDLQRKKKRENGFFFKLAVVSGLDDYFDGSDTYHTIPDGMPMTILLYGNGPGYGRQNLNGVDTCEYTQQLAYGFTMLISWRTW